jgi:hypothetical protein
LIEVHDCVDGVVFATRERATTRLVAFLVISITRRRLSAYYDEASYCTAIRLYKISARRIFDYYQQLHKTTALRFTPKLLHKYNAATASTEPQIKSMSEIDWNKYKRLLHPDFIKRASRDPEWKTIRGAINAATRARRSGIRSGDFKLLNSEQEATQRNIHSMLRHELEHEENSAVRSALGACVEAMIELDKLAWEVTRKDDVLASSLRFLTILCTKPKDLLTLV